MLLCMISNLVQFAYKYKKKVDDTNFNFKHVFEDIGAPNKLNAKIKIKNVQFYFLNMPLKKIILRMVQ